MKREKLIQGICLIAMTIVFSMFSIFNFPTKALGTEKMTLGAAPLNPAYTEYMNSEASNNSKDLDLLKNNKLGYMPSPFSFFGSKQKNQSKAFLGSSQLPTSYDLRAKNKLTAVRDQGDSGSCWAFATYGSLESNLKTTESTDFSENNLKNRSGFDRGPNDGGNEYMSIAYLSRWDGPVSEKDDPYNDSSTSSPKESAQKHVQEALMFGYDNDNNYPDIKQALMKNGAVFTSMFYQDDYFNSKDATYYYHGSEKSNHAVDIVGWDDNFDKNKFSDASSGIPPGNGAFIVRNSWGSSWGDKGYFYISYFDSVIGSENVVFNNAEPISNYSSVYQYDLLGQTTPVQFSSNPNIAWFANVFTANSNDALSAVSFYTNGPDSEYEVWLYDYNKGTLTKNKRLASGTIEYTGYHTVKLANSIALTTGSKFAVAVKLKTPGEDPYPLALEEPVANYSSQAESVKGQSFVSGDGSTWTDLKDTDYSNANVCLKAFTSAKSIKSLTVDPSSATILQGETQPITVQAVNSEGITEDVTSLVEASSTNSDVAGVSNGNIEAIGPGKATISLTYLGEKVTVKVEVLPDFELRASLNPVIIEKDKSVKVNITATYSTGKSDDITSKVKLVLNPFDPQNVSVNKSTLTGLIEGETKVTVSYLGKSLSLPVKVIPQLTSLTTIPNSLAIASGDQSTPQVIAMYGKDFEDVSTICTAVSSKSSVATVTNGVITGLSPGTAVISYIYGSKVATIKVTVVPKLTKLEVDKSFLNIEEMKQASIKLKAYYSTGKTVDVTKDANWTIETGGEKYITISNGKITGLSTGTTQINVSYQDQTVTVSVSVIPQLRSIKADPDSLKLSSKDEFTPKIMADYLNENAEDVVTKCEATSTKESVAKILEGKIIAVAPGNCIVNYVYGSKKTSVRVKVI